MEYKQNKSFCLLNEIDWGNGRILKCNPYWNDDTSFALDISDGELTDKDGNDYFIHCEYNCDDEIWYYVFEIWFENDNCSIFDIPKNERDEYLTETEMEELRVIIFTMVLNEKELEKYKEIKISRKGAKARQPTLENLVYRLKLDTKLLEKHPENKELLEMRIKRHKDDIANYVTSERFSYALKTFNL